MRYIIIKKPISRMRYILEYDEFLNEGWLSNKIELYKNKINTTYKNLKGVQSVMYKVSSILFKVGLAASIILWGIYKIHTKYPEFVKKSYSGNMASMYLLPAHESIANEKEEMIKNIRETGNPSGKNPGNNDKLYCC